ncbi:hypothetical protein CgunFtcFv8_025071 [Champsocephalus gunnari]|uniref:Uncharacterized protein n=1 Tax=Champsocephalus gunnari TaxID=52237 RepID=A0AAN8DFS6_CHAGU|nr:hypothetical protein CgunFtcFv8_025071 [Champsocephalus gunnari]
MDKHLAHSPPEKLPCAQSNHCLLRRCSLLAKTTKLPPARLSHRALPIGTCCQAKHWLRKNKYPAVNLPLSQAERVGEFKIVHLPRTRLGQLFMSL